MTISRTRDPSAEQTLQTPTVKGDSSKLISEKRHQLEEADFDDADQSDLNDYSDEVENESSPTKVKSSSTKNLSPDIQAEPLSPAKYELDEDTYDIDHVVDKMCGRKDRKIPGTVYKPHSETVLLIQSVALGQP